MPFIKKPDFDFDNIYIIICQVLELVINSTITDQYYSPT